MQRPRPLLPAVVTAMMLTACAEPSWTDESVYLAMKAAAGPSTLARATVPMLQLCDDDGEVTYDDGVTTCTVAKTNDGANVLDGTFSWRTDYESDLPLLVTDFEGVQFGDGDHQGELEGGIDLPLRDGGEFLLRNLRLTLQGDPFEHWTEQENEFAVTVEPQLFAYSAWTGGWSEEGAWSTGRGSVELSDGTVLDIGVWAERGLTCFDTLPMTRIEIEDGELDLTIEPSDWESCSGCWTWHNDAGESGELCLNDLL